MPLGRKRKTDNSEKSNNSYYRQKKVPLFSEKVKTNDVAPRIVNDRAMLPARFVAENLGAFVEWDGDKQLVTIMGKNLKTNEDVTILITIGAEYAVVNGENVKLDSPAFIENDRTYTPIRFISEHLGASVEWLENEQKGYYYKKICWQKNN
ncbi:MAG: copper amine oxidase N-terminal domain-containing protein [Clostridiales bacterium]|nr:MAG: copper amine oxidase N-terminal domain-containing protein [Clostridiales bacterium]